MTKKELLDIVTVIVMAYPDRFKEDSILGMVTAWYAFFKDDDAGAVELAVTKHIACNKWPPSIAEIRSAMVDVFHPELIPPDLAWASVADALYVAGSFGGQEQFNFPPMISRAIDIIGWSSLKEMHRGHYGANGKDGLDRLAFMNAYEPIYARARSEASLPQAIQAAVVKVTQLAPDTTIYLNAMKKAREDEENRWNDVWKRSLERSSNALEEPTKQALLEDKK